VGVRLIIGVVNFDRALSGGISVAE